MHAGDLVSAAFLEQLEALGPPVYAVHGNVDEPAVVASLPAERVVEISDVRIGVVHDAGRAAGRGARLAARFPGCDAVVYGHTHVAEVARHRGVWILNPGSPTERRRSPARSMALLEVSAGSIRAEVVLLT